jgi:hypothetical protein
MKIKCDVFPAVFTLAGSDFRDPITSSTLPNHPSVRRIDSVRIVVTETHILIAQDSPHGPSLVFKEEIDQNTFHGSATKGDDYTVTTMLGKRFAFRKDNSCGCGSRLRTWRPYDSLTA